MKRFRTDSKTSLQLWIFKTWWKSYQKQNFCLVESLYHLESFNLLEQTIKPVISLLIKLYWQQPLLNPWPPFDKMKHCLKTLFYSRKPKGLLKIYLKLRKCIAKRRLYNSRKYSHNFFFFFSILCSKVHWSRFETLTICSCLYKSNTLNILLC